MTRVAIVGAGFAGLAAARTLRDHGIATEILEATPRPGGRARSAHATVELGPEFVHGLPPATCEIVRAAGLPLDEVSDTHHLWRDGKLRPDHDMFARFGTLLEAAAKSPREESARAYMERELMRPDDAALFAMLVEGFYAAPLDDISVAGIASDASGAGGDDAKQFRVRGGYHRVIESLVARLADVPIHYEHVVHAIDWRSDRVELAHSHGTAVVDRAIVTVSAGVLQAGALRFTPSLDEPTRALGGLAMGQVVKVVSCFREPIWREYAPRGLEFVHGNTTRFPTFWVRSARDEHQLTAWAGGPYARALATYTPEQLGDVVLDEFAGTLHMPRAALEAARLHVHHHDYRRDPFSLGAYSYMRVGGSGAAATLARPLANRLFLAGEATDHDYEGSVAGALASGVRAAHQVLAAR